MTAAELQQDAAFVSAVAGGLADALGVAQESVKVTGLEFVDAAARRLSSFRRLQTTSDSKALKTTFEIDAADSAATQALNEKLTKADTLAALQDKASTRMMAADFTLLALLASPPSVDTAQVPVVASTETLEEETEMLEDEDTADGAGAGTSFQTVAPATGVNSEPREADDLILGMEENTAAVVGGSLAFSALCLVLWLSSFRGVMSVTPSEEGVPKGP